MEAYREAIDAAYAEHADDRTNESPDATQA